MSDGLAERLFPQRPILAVSAAVFREGAVLLARRAKAPMIGCWSLPGGCVEVGETLAQALARELKEEVGIEARVVAFNRHVEPIDTDAGRVKTHFVIASFVARWLRGEPRTSHEIDATQWIDPARCSALTTTPGLMDIVASAARIERSLP